MTTVTLVVVLVTIGLILKSGQVLIVQHIQRKSTPQIKQSVTENVEEQTAKHSKTKKYEFSGLKVEDTCLRCQGKEWSWIPDSLAQFCTGCGFVRVLHGEGYEAGATLQEWIEDICPNRDE